MSDDPKRIVERGYDTIAERYAQWAQNEVEGSPALGYLERLLGLLAPGADVLELGCGNGEPAARLLAPGHRYTGVDISSEQLRRASALVPAGRFIKADYTKLEFPASSVDAAVALYTFGHVPRAQVAEVYTRIASWLKPGGYLLATTGREDSSDTVDEDWLGAPMFFSGFDVETNLRLLAEAGLDVLEHEVVCQDEAEQGEACFLWVLARRS
ncbi:MAG TPA: class I SAM-dependent methyltransferase [Gaiellaceae bacterium]